MTRTVQGLTRQCMIQIRVLLIYHAHLQSCANLHGQLKIPYHSPRLSQPQV